MEKDMIFSVHTHPFITFKNSLKDIDMSFLNKYEFEEAQWHGEDYKSWRNSKVAWIPYNEEEIYERVEKFMLLANDVWNFNIERSEPMQYTLYDKNGHYAWHRDFNGQQLVENKYIRKLSATVQLSDPNDYVGGELEIETMSGEICRMTKEQGSLTVFPSYLKHRVTPVTKGIRKSLVLWLIGEDFK